MFIAVIVLVGSSIKVLPLCSIAPSRAWTSQQPLWLPVMQSPPNGVLIIIATPLWPIFTHVASAQWSSLWDKISPLTAISTRGGAEHICIHRITHLDRWVTTLTAISTSGGDVWTHLLTWPFQWWSTYSHSLSISLSLSLSLTLALTPFNESIILTYQLEIYTNDNLTCDFLIESFDVYNIISGESETRKRNRFNWKTFWLNLQITWCYCCKCVLYILSWKICCMIWENRETKECQLNLKSIL